MMSRLSVNINKVATLRNARGGNVPELVKVAKDCENFGAEGITVHPRPDERHIRYQDVYDLAPIVSTEFNIEGYPSERFIELVLEAKPAQVTLVPDPPGVLTSDAGWKVSKQQSFLQEVNNRFQEAGIRTSIFMETDLNEIEEAKRVGVDRIELYTGPYAAVFEQDKEAAIQPFVAAAEHADNIGLGVNAGHDLNLDNLRFFKQNILALAEVSIGHALIADALYMGLEKTIKTYLAALEE